MSARSTVCAVIPAAGRGTRLDAEVPKTFVELAPRVRVFDLLFDAIAPAVDHLHLVISPAGGGAARLAPHQRERVSLGVQERPAGTGDAVLGAHTVWERFDHILVAWGDQVGIAGSTVARVVEAQRRGGTDHMTIALVPMEAPYVRYVLDRSGRLRRVLQQREGDRCGAAGLADVGLFALSVPALAATWAVYLDRGPGSLGSGERHLLPFLVHLSLAAGWSLAIVWLDDPSEARGLNTPADLARARSCLAARPRRGP